MPLRTRPQILLGLALATGCTPSSVGDAPAPRPTQESIARLESLYAQDTTNLELQVRLGASYQATGRPEGAYPLLWDANIKDPESAPTTLYLGLTFEDLEQYRQARVYYERFLALGPPANVADRVRNRLPAVRRMELRAGVAQAIRLEGSLSAAPAPHSVGVFPFLYQGDDPSFEPLGRALAHMLTTDLGQVDRITVLERVESQLLLDELALAQSAYLDPATGARGGRILGAGRIVQGRIEGSASDLLVEAVVVPVEDPGSARTVSERDASESLFDLEARLAFAILESLGVELAPAERAIHSTATPIVREWP